MTVLVESERHKPTAFSRDKDILQRVESKFGVTDEYLSSRKQDMFITRARQAAMYLLKKHTTLSSTQIGMRVGNRDSATVNHGVRAAEERMKSNSYYAGKIAEIESELL